MNSTDQSPPIRHVSITGLTAILFGLALVAAEYRTEVLLREVGGWAHSLLFIAAVSLSVWGLKEIIADWWPGSVARRTRSRRNRFHLPVEGRLYLVIVIVLFVGSAIGRSNTLMLVFSLLVGPFIVNGGIIFSMLKQLSVRRSVPQRVMAGEPFAVEVELSNPKRWLSAWLMSVRDEVSNGYESLHPEVLFTRVARRRRERGQYQLRLSQRGRYSFGPVQVNSRFPLGIVERGLVLTVTDEILVYPKIGRLTAGWQRQMASATQLASHAQPRAGTFDDDFHRIREYRRGDDRRAIHWRTTARRNELMVREYRESRDRQLILLLDLYLPGNASEKQKERLEYAISFAATMCHDQLLSGRETGLCFAANTARLQEWKGTSEHGGRDELFDLFALLQPNSLADLRSLREVARREQTSHNRTVLITAVPGRADELEWNQMNEVDEVGHTWTDPPQMILADPEELAAVFSLERLAPA